MKMTFESENNSLTSLHTETLGLFFEYTLYV